MTEIGVEISPVNSEPHQDPAEPTNQQPLSSPTATPLERRSNDTADSLHSAEEGVGVNGKSLCVHVYSIVSAHIILLRSRSEDMCPSSQSRTRAFRLQLLFDEVHAGIPST